MAVTLEGRVSRYIGLSTDRKPTPGVATFFDGVTLVPAESDIPVGSSFLETDTWRIARWDGSVWTYQREDATTAELLREVLASQQRMVELLEAIESKV